MKTIIFKTDNTWAPAILRILLGIVLLGHGAQKMLGWFHGYGFEGTLNFFAATKGIPRPVGLFIIIIEFFGSISLLAGFATRLWSISMFFLFLGIVYTSHLQNGFFMNWSGTQKGEGYEFFLLALAISFSLVITGGGKYAADLLVLQKTKRKAPPAGVKTINV